MRKGSSSLPTDTTMRLVFGLIVALVLLTGLTVILEALGINVVCRILGGVFSPIADTSDITLPC